MQARYPGRDAITGHRINPGDEIKYDTVSRRAWIAEPGDMRITPAYAPNPRYVSHVIRTSGGTFYRNKAGRCEDAPCCGCCTI